LGVDRDPAKLIPQLLNSYKKAHGGQSPGFAEMWNKVAEKIIDGVVEEKGKARDGNLLHGLQDVGLEVLLENLGVDSPSY
jgi:hypothetical protein